VTTPRKPKATKSLTASNIEALGAPHLAGLLLELAASQPALKRRLRMELAAEISPADLAAEIDKRIATLAASKARISWRKRGEFLTDLDVQRAMIAERLGGLDPDLAVPRALAFLDLASSLGARVKDPKDEMSAIFTQGAEDLGALIGKASLSDAVLAEALIDAIVDDIFHWADWIDVIGPVLSPSIAARVLAEIGQPDGRRMTPARLEVIKGLADAAQDVDAYIASIPPAERSDPDTGAEIARRLLAANRAADAVEALKASDPRTSTKKRFAWGATTVGALDHNFDWESVYIDSLEQSGDAEAAQSARWASFERTLSPERLKAIIARLPDFEDVEAADKAFAHAARDPDALRGLAFLMAWPALPEAARMIADRADELKGPASQLEAWASRLLGRQQAAARTLLLAAVQAATREGQPREAIEALRLEAEAV
jgi:hypothetical protein